MHNHLASFAPLVVLGIVFSLTYERTGRIGTAIVAHALFNSYSVIRIFIDPNAT
jgi:membrane protease YdiL (CAAX protease family)